MNNEEETSMFIEACTTQLVSLYTASKEGKKRRCG